MNHKRQQTAHSRPKCRLFVCSAYDPPKKQTLRLHADIDRSKKQKKNEKKTNNNEKKRERRKEIRSTRWKITQKSSSMVYRHNIASNRIAFNEKQIGETARRNEKKIYFGIQCTIQCTTKHIVYALSIEGEEATATATTKSTTETKQRQKREKVVILKGNK